MNDSSLWKRYCSFYEKEFSEQIDYNRSEMQQYFLKWKKTNLAKVFCKNVLRNIKDVPLTKYDDYPMLTEFGRKTENIEKRTLKKSRELFRNYYDRITNEAGSSLNPYMVEPYYLCMKSTGTTGQSKWVVHGETFWENFSTGAIVSTIVACSDGWGETKLETKDKAFNVTAPIPYISGWGTWASQTILELVPPIEVTDNLQDMRETFSLLLRSIEKGEKISVGGGLGSMFYMICKYFVDPQEFYAEYYQSMDFGLKKILLYIKLLQLRLRRTERTIIRDFLPLKGVLIGGMESRLYIDFFKNEFNLEPLHAYGSTEAGNLMRGDPDRKTDLVPDLKVGYFEFKTEEDEIRDIDQLKKGETYDLIITPFGSIFFRYDMEDLFKVIDFRDDGMPIFAFEGRKKAVIDMYGYRLSPNVVIQALSKAGLKDSDKWAVVKLYKPKEHLHFLMEKTWQHSESEAEKIVFSSLLETDRNVSHRGRTLADYITEFGIKNPSEIIKVEYLRSGAFLRYQMMKAREGSPVGQYKPPKVIQPEQMEIYEALRTS